MARASGILLEATIEAIGKCLSSTFLLVAFFGWFWMLLRWEWRRSPETVEIYTRGGAWGRI
jgi:hypothetical protein